VIAPWHFEKKGKQVEVAVAGRLTVNDEELAIRAAVDGVGVLYTAAMPRWRSRRAGWFPCLYRKLDSAIMMMKSAEDGRRYNAAHVLDRPMDRCVLIERAMSPQLIIVGGILRQNPA
jgi:hypothetical protein